MGHDDCILWTGRLNDGYGRIKGRYVHVVCWEEANGPVPPGKELHHRCKVRNCINLEHLEPLTRAEHRALHGGNGVKQRLAKTHCKYGHEYTPANSYFFPNGWRKCRECARLDARARRAMVRSSGTKLTA